MYLWCKMPISEYTAARIAAKMEEDLQRIEKDNSIIDYDASDSWLDQWMHEQIKGKKFPAPSEEERAVFQEVLRELGQEQPLHTEKPVEATSKNEELHNDPMAASHTSE